MKWIPIFAIRLINARNSQTSSDLCHTLELWHIEVHPKWSWFNQKCSGWNVLKGSRRQTNERKEEREDEESEIDRVPIATKMPRKLNQLQLNYLSTVPRLCKFVCTERYVAVLNFYLHVYNIGACDSRISFRRNWESDQINIWLLSIDGACVTCCGCAKTARRLYRLAIK